VNRLQYEKSPYLLQHAENPVDWVPWGKEAFAAAKAEDKPVFLSIGYSTCHWCHVMAHESFEDEGVAALLNRSFISVKVDREERPDVDSVYMAACVEATGSGGWPLTVLMTPEQKPFWAGTYLPRKQLMTLLEGCAALWESDRASLREAGERFTGQLREVGGVAAGTPSRALAAEAVRRLDRSYDQEWGGFGRAPKFPSPHTLLFLLRYSVLTGDEKALAMAEGTLSHMLRGGIHDHIGGGFCRYSTDRRWLVPHFEKMLYDNALMALVCTEAWEITRREVYRRTAVSTIGYLLRELRDAQGGFLCGQDADSGGGEGEYYLFTPEELRGVLGDEAETFCACYGITEEGNFEGRSIPNRLHAPEAEPVSGEMARRRERVYAYRRARMALRKDDKVLTAWNGLAVAALARAALALDEPGFLRAAQEAADFVLGSMTDEKGRLLARWRDGEAAHPGKLDDYAFFLWGLLELYGASFSVRYLETAARLAGDLLDRFFDEEAGGFFPYADDGEQLITRRKEAGDGALPSGNSVSALCLSRLARLTGESRWREAADRQLRFLAGAAADYPPGYGFALCAMMEELWPSAELIVTGPAVPEELFSFLRERPRPNLTVMVKTPENVAALSALAPFTADYPAGAEETRYYLCRDRVCAQPVRTAAELRELWERQ